MKKDILIALMLCLAPTAMQAESRLNGPALMLARSAAESVAASRSGATTLALADAETQATVIVILNDFAALEQIEALGATIVDTRADMAVVSAPAAILEEIGEVAGVVAVELGYDNRPMLLEARKNANVDAVHNGEGLEKAYDGTGVIVGMMDIGFDPNHVNFLNEDGSNRVSHYWEIKGTNSAIKEYTGAEIANYTTDNVTETHGTHVMGIIAGSYKGNADVVAVANGKRATKKYDYPIEYYGVAPGAEMAPCAGTLDGNNIIVAAGKIADYAKSQGKPAVLNLSLGHNTGPHDGTTASNKYLAELGEDMLITISAGNEGGSAVSTRKTFTATDRELKTMFGTATTVYGACDIWADDGNAFSFTIIGVDKTTGSIVYQKAFNASSQKAYTVLCGSYYNASGYVIDKNIDTYFGKQGAFQISCSKNALNGRRNVNIYMSTGSGTNSNVVPGIIVNGTVGQTVHLYPSGTVQFISNKLEGYTHGDDLESINDMACGDNVFAIGAYVNQGSFPTVGSTNLMGYGSTKGAIASFSSYGTLPNGTKLPHIAGPGEAVISSYSHYYMASGNDYYDGKYYTAKITGANRDEYWQEASGTSMSSPFVAGVLALWLQADPTLTYSEVKTIMAETAIQDSFTAAKPERFGFGKIDALAGIKKVLARNGVADVKVDSKIAISQTSRDAFDVYAPGATAVSATAYTLAGATVTSVSAAGDTAVLTTDGLAPGVYIIRAAAGVDTATRKVIVK